MLKVWGRLSSLNVQKVMWLIGELDLEYEHIPAGGRFGGLNTAEFRALNPHARVPVVEDGELAVWESHSILRYLAARHGGETWWPEDPGLRSQGDRWMDWTLATLQPAFLGGLFGAYYRTPESQRNWQAIRRNVMRCGQLFGILDRLLADRTFLAGDSISLADIAAGAQLYRYYELDLERPALPNVEAWYAQLQERAAYREHVMTAFDELRGDTNF